MLKIRHHWSRNSRHCPGGQIKPQGLSDCGRGQPQSVPPLCGWCRWPAADRFMIRLRASPIMPISSLSPPRMMLFRPSSIRSAGIAGQYVVHCSGADSLDVLEPARIVGAQVGSFHPLQTFASIQKAIDNLPGSTFALEAEGDLLDILKEMAAALEGRWIKLGAGDKAAYHTAAVMTSNYLVTLVKLATDLWDSFGIPREQAIQALLPLLKGTINNIENLSVPNALTGPIARGDIGTVQIHLNTLKETAPAIIPAYCELGLQTIPVALAKGKINERQAKELEDILKQTLKSNTEREDKCVQC